MKNGLLNILKESINEGGVKKDLYRNLKLAKRNEFYEEDGDTKESFEAAGLDANELEIIFRHTGDGSQAFYYKLGKTKSFKSVSVSKIK